MARHVAELLPGLGVVAAPAIQHATDAAAAAAAVADHTEYKFVSRRIGGEEGHFPLNEFYGAGKCA